MTRKQIRKLADRIVKLELIHSDPNSSKEEKTQAEYQIMQLSCMIGTLPNALDLMSEIDELVQQGIEKHSKGE